MELWKFYRKIAKRTGWWFVVTNFLRLSKAIKTIREASEKFSVMYLYEVWMTHNHLAVSISFILSLTADYEHRKGRNYQNELKKLFGAQ